MLKKLSEVTLSLHRGSREIPMSAFQDWAFECLRTVIEFDSAAWVTGRPNDADWVTATLHTQHAYKQPLQLLSDWMKCKGAATFPKRLSTLPETTCICTPSTDMEPEVAAHCRRYKIEQILTTPKLDAVTGILELISLYRSDLARPFSEEERLFKQCLIPHLSESWRVCRIRHLASLGQPTCTLDTFAAGADTKGILQVVDPSFTRLLRDEWPNWRGPQLPIDLLNAYQTGESRYVGQHTAFQLLNVADHLLLRVRKKTAVDGLNRREREVAALFAAGRSHKEVAMALNISPFTVRNHLSAIYRKLGIGSKVTLAALIQDGQDHQ